MGIYAFRSRCGDESHDRSYARTQIEYVYVDNNQNNPDPTRFVIEKVETIDRFLIASIHYPNCKNYEGRKTLVFENVSEKTLRGLTSLDPHFCNSARHISPIARFEPTTRGWRYARAFCSHTHEK